MSEKQRTQPLRTGPAPGAAPFGHPPDGPGDSQGLVAIRCGVHAELLPLAGRTVAQIRHNFGDRLNIPSDAVARVGGENVDDATVVESGQVLEFAREAGEKGVADELLGTLDKQVARVFGIKRARAQTEPQVVLEGKHVVVTSPEGVVSRQTIERAVREARPRTPDSAGILADGIKAVHSMPKGAIVVHQSPPRVHTFRWIAGDSPAPYGPEARYRQIRLALPYLIVLAVFQLNHRGRLRLRSCNEAFFTRRSLKSLDDELLFPCLLNVSKFVPQQDHPLAWICTQNLDLSGVDGRAPDEEVRTGSLHALVQHLLDTGFNTSSDFHEHSSWFTETIKAGIDPRLESLLTWEQASQNDPGFATEVAWLPTDHTLKQVLERIERRQSGQRELTAKDLARVVVNARPERRPSK